MNPALVAFVLEKVIPFLIQTVLPFVLKSLPEIMNFLKAHHPQAHAEVTTAIKKVVPTDQGPGFDWHSGP